MAQSQTNKQTHKQRTIQGVLVTHFTSLVKRVTNLVKRVPTSVEAALLDASFLTNRPYISLCLVALHGAVLDKQINKQTQIPRSVSHSRY
jgi:hypothetical protein